MIENGFSLPKCFCNSFINVVFIMWIPLKARAAVSAVAPAAAVLRPATVFTSPVFAFSHPQSCSVLFTFDLDWDYNSGLSSKLSLSLNDLYREYEKAGFTPVSTDRAAVQAVGLNGNISSGVSALFV